MKRLIYINFILGAMLIVFAASCGGGTTANSDLTQEQKDSIERVKQDSIRVADSIAAVKHFRADSIAQAKQKENEAKIATLSKKFRFKKDEFENRTWVYHNTTPKYTNYNSIHIYFMTDGDGKASNLRFCVHYEADEWLFIKNMIFNIDGDNVTFVPDKMERDCGYGGRIWEWCDESYKFNKDLINKIANANNVKVKFNGERYYDTKNMSAKQLQGYKETLELYKLMGGEFD